MLTFFNEHFGRHLVSQTGDAMNDATSALRGGHLMQSGAVQRISAGWGIVRPGRSTLQFKLAAAGLEYSTQTRYEAFLAELENWDGTPRIFMEFGKRPIPAGNLFRTFDLRCVRICSPGGVETFDFTKEPTKDSCKTHRILWATREKRDISKEKLNA